MIYLRLFWEFFKTGLFAVGGGLATLPFLKDISTRTGWFTHQQLTDMVAVAESTPGAIGVNTATYVGFETAGIPGGIIATLGLITPSIIVIVIIASLLKSFADNRYVNAVFKCLRPASLALIVAAGYSVAVSTFLRTEAAEDALPIDIKALLLALVVFVFAQFVKPTKGLHPIIFIAVSAVAGIVLF